jgi:hypothetical protein
MTSFISSFPTTPIWKVVESIQKSLKKQNYKLKDFEIDEVEYADGHTFWHHIKLQVELNGQVFEWMEVAEIYKEKLLIGGRDDLYVKFRDGKMNFDIEKEVEVDGI